MADFDDTQLTRTVIESFAGAPDPCTRELVAKLVAHVHALVRDVEAAFDEWLRVIDFVRS